MNAFLITKKIWGNVKSIVRIVFQDREEDRKNDNIEKFDHNNAEKSISKRRATDDER